MENKTKEEAFRALSNFTVENDKEIVIYINQKDGTVLDPLFHTSYIPNQLVYFKSIGQIGWRLTGKISHSSIKINNVMWGDFKLHKELREKIMCVLLMDTEQEWLIQYPSLFDNHYAYQTNSFDEFKELADIPQDYTIKVYDTLVKHNVKRDFIKQTKMTNKTWEQIIDNDSVDELFKYVEYTKQAEVKIETINSLIALIRINERLERILIEQYANNVSNEKCVAPIFKSKSWFSTKEHDHTKIWEKREVHVTPIDNQKHYILKVPFTKKPLDHFRESSYDLRNNLYYDILWEGMSYIGELHVGHNIDNNVFRIILKDGQPKPMGLLEKLTSDITFYVKDIKADNEVIKYTDRYGY